MNIVNYRASHLKIMISSSLGYYDSGVTKFKGINTKEKEMEK